MAIACKMLWSLECACSHEQPICKLSVWPLSQAVPFSSPSKHLRRLDRITPISCKPRETLLLPSEEAAPSFSQEDLYPHSKNALDDASRAAQGSFESDDSGSPLPKPTTRGVFSSELPLDMRVAERQEDVSLSSLMQIPQTSDEVRLTGNEQVGLKVIDDDDDDDDKEESMIGFRGAKGAVVKPLTAKKLAYFSEGYLETVTTIQSLDWVTIVPTRMLAKGDRLVLEHNDERVMLFWFEGRIYAIENRSPAAPKFKEAFSKAVISEDGLITCPATGSKYDIRTGQTIQWLPNSFFLDKLFTPTINDVSVYAVRASPNHIFIHMKPLFVGGYYPLAEFTGNRIWEGPNYEEPIIYDDLEFGFTEENELTNGRFAMLGFLTLLILETTVGQGQGILKGSGILDFLYKFLPGFPILRY